MINLKNIMILLFAHMIADFVLQNDFIAIQKSKHLFILFIHCYIWSGTISLCLYYLGLFTINKFIFLIVGHFLIDYLKCRKKDKSKSLTKDLWIDQLCHLAQLGIVLI